MQVKTARPNWFLIVLLVAGLLLASTVVLVHPRGARIPLEAIDALKAAGNEVVIVQVEPAEISQAEPAPPPGNKPPCLKAPASLGSTQFLKAVESGTRLFALSPESGEILINITPDKVKIVSFLASRKTWHFSEVTHQTFFNAYDMARGGTRASTRLNSVLDGLRSPFPSEEVTKAQAFERLGWDGNCK